MKRVVTIAGRMMCAAAWVLALAATCPSAEPVPPAMVCTPEIELVPVKGGCFRMGDIFEAGYKDEKPVHEVCLRDFSIGRYEVTQAQWQAVMGTNPAKEKKGGNYPVEEISWKDTQLFIEKLNSLTGRHYRLPTEAEWEYAARSGGKDEKWAGTSDDEEIRNFAWYEGKFGGESHPVGAKKPNGLGIYDMSGNVWEWVADWYQEDYYLNSPKNDPQGPAQGEKKVLRGGSFFNYLSYARTAKRLWYDPALRSNIFGLRLAMSGAVVIPPEGLVPNQETAVAVAEAILVARFGKDILKERPFTARLENDLWNVTGTKPKDATDSAVSLSLSRRDGQVVKLVRGKQQ